MGVYSIAAGGGLKKPRTVYPNMGINSPYIYGAMVPIATYTATASYGRYFGFGSIPQTFQDLRLVLSIRSDLAATTDLFGMYFNSGEGGTINSETYLSGDGTSVTSIREANLFTLIRSNIAGNNATSGIFSTVTIDILNYANTVTNKTCLARTATELGGSGNSTLTASLARITSAVTTINVGVIGSGTNIVAGSTASLYGIRAGNS
jgi:hypothetical protein